jgi:hypothetical protein
LDVSDERRSRPDLMIIVRIFRLCATIAARRDVAAYRLYAGQIHIAPVRQPTLAAIKSVLKSARGIRWDYSS